MAKKAIDETGNRYGRLVVEHRDPQKRRRPYWFCRCDCGGTAIVEGNELRQGSVQSCGCYQRECISKRHRTHGKSKTQAYRQYRSMIDRCEKPRTHGYKYYGAKGIKVCERWRSSYAAFLEDMGPRPEGMTLDRIDSSGDYEPGNCRWATIKEQNNNKSDNHIIELDGERLNLQQWSDRTGLGRKTITSRIKAGWSIRDALTRPVRKARYERRTPEASDHGRSPDL